MDIYKPLVDSSPKRGNRVKCGSSVKSGTKAKGRGFCLCGHKDDACYEWMQ